MIELLEDFFSGQASSGGGGKRDKKKYGATIDVLLGNLSQDGMLQTHSSSHRQMQTLSVYRSSLLLKGRHRLLYRHQAL